jgi:hypothetical protein
MHLVTTFLKRAIVKQAIVLFAIAIVCSSCGGYLPSISGTPWQPVY